MRRCGPLAQRVLHGTEIVWQTGLWSGAARLGGRTLLVSSSLDDLSVSSHPRLSFALLNAGVQSVPCTLSTYLPTTQAVEAGVEMFRRTGARSITVVGNGAVIDAAKGMAELIDSQRAPGSTALPLLVIPTSISPVGCHPAWSCLHAEDDVLISRGGQRDDSSTTIIFDAALLTQGAEGGGASPKAFVSPLVSAVYLASHLVDSEFSSRMRITDATQAVSASTPLTLPSRLSQLAPFFSGSAGSTQQQQQQQQQQHVEELCQLAEIVGAVRRESSSLSTPSALGFHDVFPLELTSQLALLNGARSLQSPAPWPFSWLHVLSLHALVEMTGVGREAGAGAGAQAGAGAGGGVEPELLAAANAAVERISHALGLESSAQFARSVQLAAAAVHKQAASKQFQSQSQSRRTKIRSSKNDDADPSSALSLLPVDGAVEGLIAVHEELENAHRTRNSPSAARDIRTAGKDSDKEQDSPRLRLLRSDLFLDLATAATQPPV